MTVPITVDVTGIQKQAAQLLSQAAQMREQATSARGAGTPLGAYGTLPEPVARALDPLDADLAAGLDAYAEVLEAAAQGLNRVADQYMKTEADLRKRFDAAGSFFKRSKGRRK